MRELVQGEAVRVAGWVAGEEVERDNPTWAALDDRQFVYSSLLQARAPEGPPAPPTDARTAGKWIDVNLALQVATAYEGRSAVRWALVSTGRPGWETREGTFPILRRVAKETMDGSTLIGEGPTGTGASYRVEDVRYTQYFSRDGSAIHENTWRDPSAFGIPGSHGCIGMLPLEASWFWRWAEVGTPLHIHR